MTGIDLINALRRAGFTAGETFVIIDEFIEDVDALTPKALANVIPIFKRVMEQYKKYLENSINEGE
jgi:hypothetical protein